MRTEFDELISMPLTYFAKNSLIGANRLSPMNRAVKGMSAIIGLLVSRLPRRRVRGWGAGRDADAARDALPPDRYRELGDESAQKDIRMVSAGHRHGQILSSWFL